MTYRQNRWILLSFVTAVMLACVSPLAPAPAPIPTFDPNSLITAVVETSNAAASQTAALLPQTFTPSVTPPPSATPSITPTATETFVFLLVTNTPTKSKPTAIGSTPKAYACELVSQKPADNTPVPLNASFDVKWQIKNTGSKIWDDSSFDFHYTSGDILHQVEAYDFYKDVYPGDTIDFIVDMKGPNSPGTFKTFWKIRTGKTEFCQVSITVEVK